MKIKFGSIVTDGSGKLGGHVYAKNRGGNYVRTNRTPANPQTVAQQTIRNILTIFTQQWRALNESQRQSWRNAVELFQRTDQFGDVRQLSGKNLYVSLNNTLVAAGKSPLSTAPQPEPIPECIVEETRIDASGQDMQIYGRFTPNGLYAVVATPPLSAGIRFVKNRLRVIGYFQAESASELIEITGDAWDAYVAKFGESSPGDTIYVGAYGISTVGQRSPVSSVKAIT